MPGDSGVEGRRRLEVDPACADKARNRGFMDIDVPAEDGGARNSRYDRAPAAIGKRPLRLRIGEIHAMMDYYSLDGYIFLEHCHEAVCICRSDYAHDFRSALQSDD